MLRPAFSLCLLVLLVGCTKQNPAFDESDASANASATVGPITTTGAITTGTSIGGTTLADTGGSGTGGDGTSGSDPTTGSADATTTGVDPGTSTSASGSTTEPMEPPPPEHLQLYSPQNCTMPLWCYITDQDVFSGSPARTRSQACFTPTTQPPYGLTRVGYVIAAAFGDPAASLRIHERTGMGPGKLLTELPLDAGGLTVGAHAIVLDPPIVIDAPAFCLGLIGGDKEDPGAGLGVAVDTTVLPPQQSYLRIEGDGGCEVPDWQDISVLKPNPSGAWCIDADVVKQPG